MNTKPEVGSPLLKLQSRSQINFKLIQKLGHQKITSFLAFNEEDNQVYAMKVFPHENGKISHSYAQEAKFCQLSHPNIVKFFRTQANYKVNFKDQNYQSSYILMELARYKDFGQLSESTSIFEDDKLLRTYFIQLIAGLEYLHSKGIAHMDLRPENLLLCEDLRLKISNYHVAHETRDAEILHGGIKNYTAPEVLKNDCTDTQAADIYSAGIILFVLKTGYFPYMKDAQVEGYDLFELLRNEDPLFWQVHKQLKQGEQRLSPEFKALFMSMVKEDVFERATIDEIKNSAWFHGPIYHMKDLPKKLSNILPDLDVLSR